MKNFTLNLKAMMFLVMGASGLFLLSGCGSSNTTVAASSTGTCSSGYIYSTTYATCLEQTTACSGLYGLYNNSCVYAGTTTSTTSTTCSSGYIYSTTYASCLPQTTACSGLYAIYNGSCVLATTTTTTTTTTTHSPYEGSCTYGYVQTAAGCLTQGVCTTGYGYANYWCYPATTTY